MRSEVAQSPGIARNFSLLETSRDPVRKGLRVFLEGRTAEFERQNSALPLCGRFRQRRRGVFQRGRNVSG